MTALALGAASAVTTLALRASAVLLPDFALRPAFRFLEATIQSHHQSCYLIVPGPEGSKSFPLSRAVH